MALARIIRVKVDGFDSYQVYGRQGDFLEIRRQR
jgi:hypothetical protein